MASLDVQACAPKSIRSTQSLQIKIIILYLSQPTSAKFTHGRDLDKVKMLQQPQHHNTTTRSFNTEVAPTVDEEQSEGGSGATTQIDREAFSLTLFLLYSQPWTMSWRSFPSIQGTFGTYSYGVSLSLSLSLSVIDSAISMISMILSRLGLGWGRLGRCSLLTFCSCSVL